MQLYEIFVFSRLKTEFLFEVHTYVPENKFVKSPFVLVK